MQKNYCKLNFLFKLSYLNSNFALTLGYLNPALNNPALLVGSSRKYENRSKYTNCGDKHCELGMGRTWEKFSSLPAKKPRKFETATGKENF